MNVSSACEKTAKSKYEKTKKNDKNWLTRDQETQHNPESYTQSDLEHNAAVGMQYEDNAQPDEVVDRSDTQQMQQQRPIGK